MRLLKSGIDTLSASHGVLDPQTLDGPSALRVRGLQGRIWVMLASS
jgi:hypothetical protein